MSCPVLLCPDCPLEGSCLGGGVHGLLSDGEGAVTGEGRCVAAAPPAQMPAAPVLGS